MCTQAAFNCGRSCEYGLKTLKPTLHWWLDGNGWKKEDLNTKFSKGCGFNRAEEQNERQAVGVFGSTFTLKIWL